MNKWLVKHGPKVCGGIAAGILIGGLLASCGTTHGSGPAPADKNVIDGTNQHVIREPDGYRNVDFQCFDKNGIYVTSRSNVDSLPSSIFVVVNDPHCV